MCSIGICIFLGLHPIGTSPDIQPPIQPLDQDQPRFSENVPSTIPNKRFKPSLPRNIPTREFQADVQFMVKMLFNICMSVLDLLECFHKEPFMWMSNGVRRVITTKKKVKE